MEILNVVFFLAIVIAVLVRLKVFQQIFNVDFSTVGSKIKPNMNLASKIAIPLVLLGIGVYIFFKFVVIIPAGQTGVYELFGRVKDAELGSGLHLVNPLGRVTKMSVQTEEYTMSIVAEEGTYYGDDSIAALTNEGLEVKLDLTVLYRLEEVQASEIYKTVGLDYVEKIVRPSIRSIIRGETAKFSAKEIYAQKRDEFSNGIATALSADLTTRGILLEEVLLRNVLLPDRLSQSIQEKLTAEQESQRYDFVLEKETKEAARKRIEAEGQRDAQKIIDQSLSDKYLEYLYINSLKDRAGTIYVPTNPDNGMPLFKNVP